jgi:DNA polymerase elongation subunit (family B)|tara:strand:+ start:12774 stop:15401 length:2628 start_codon:yes stop_codon:yes gene_type:complete
MSNVVFITKKELPAEERKILIALFDIKEGDYILLNGEIDYSVIENNKPHVILTQLSLDNTNIKCPILYLDQDLIGMEIYKKFREKYITSRLKYDLLIDYKRKYMTFLCEITMRKYFANINNMKIYNVSMDNQYSKVIIFMANHIMFKARFFYEDYCWIECPPEQVEKYTLTGVPCKKLYNYDYKDPNVFERDLRENYRFIIDYYDYFEPIKKEEINYMTYDIETDSSVDVINTPGRIISIVYKNNFETKFMILNDGQDLSSLKGKDDVIVYEKEADMIKAFMKVFSESNVVTGFNISGFDNIYLVNRAKMLGLDPNNYSPVGKIRNDIKEASDRNDERKLEFSGVDVIDAMKYAKDKFFIYSLDKPNRFNLDYLGEFLNLGQKVHDSRGPATLWREDVLKLYEYNIQDVELCRKLEEYVGMVNYLLSFKQLMSTFNIKWSLYNSKIIDFFILCNFSKDYVFPSKKENPSEELEGAYVMKPIAEIYNYVGVVDFKSLYPNLIRQFNISYETITDYKKDNCINIDNLYYTSKDRRGLMTIVVDKLMFMKDDLSKQMEDSDDVTLPVKYNAIKTVINGIYGVSKYKYFRLYSINCARCITHLARVMVKKSLTLADEIEDCTSIYADTDSAFIHIKDDRDYDTVLKRMFGVKDEINDKIGDFIKEYYELDNKYIEMDFETFFQKLLMSKAKKKYYGYGKYIKGKTFNSDKSYGRGIDLVKKDTPAAMRPILKKLLIDVINSEDNKSLKYSITEAEEAIKNLTYNQLLITKQISRELNEYKVTPQHVTAMMYSNKYLGTDFSRANYKGGMCYVNILQKYPHSFKGKSVEAVMLNENTKLPKEMEVNYQKYIDLFIKNKMSLFLDRFKPLFNKNALLTEWM